MVCSSGEKKRVAADMEMGPTSGRSLKARRLHNFNLPSFLKWGHQRQLRCKLPEKESDDGDGGRRGDRGAAADEEEEGIDAMREKIMFDLKTAGERMKVAMFREGVSDDDDDDEEEEEDDEVADPDRGKVAAAAAAAEEEVKRWNLRTRKGRNGNGPALPVPAMVAGVSAGGYSSSSPMKGVNGGKRERFSVKLSKKEIEEDFLAMTGHRPHRRPKKRSRTVQRELDSVFPGLMLSEVKANTYKVPDTGKR